ESKVKFVDNVAIMIVPFDRIDKSFLNDFGEKLHEIIGIKYIVSSENIAMGSPDRQIEQQYDARRLRDVLKEKFNIQQSSPIVGYLGITDKDIFTKNYNFLFGWAGQGYGVVSCFQFKEGVVIPSNDKFLNTVVKQGVSSSLHILGVKRNPADLLSSSACLSRYI
ncbi:MAG: hypothetical protein L6416_07140, partial [Candidatus Omnitrophica bacterium]|nr:hypothetical protein [Candidatus Omnitrophota bacterium]